MCRLMLNKRVALGRPEGAAAPSALSCSNHSGTGAGRLTTDDWRLTPLFRVPCGLSRSILRRVAPSSSSSLPPAFPLYRVPHLFAAMVQAPGTVAATQARGTRALLFGKSA